MYKVILLGDSIFDNATYVPGEPAVVEQLNQRLEGTGRAELLAVDGHVTHHVANQAEGIPADATHLFVSVGGNDALQAAPILHHEGPSQTMLAVLTQIRVDFQENYRSMLDVHLPRDLPVIVCTIYDAVPDMESLTHPSAAAALSMFNDVIVREATLRGLPVIDLRSVCDAAEDYSHLSPIEPSAIGGEKIARVIHHVLLNHDFGNGGARIYGSI